MDNVVVVGAGLAAHRLVTALRRRGFDGSLVVIGDEEHHPYDRPPLSKQVLSGSKRALDLYFPIDGLDVDWRLGTAAAAVDTVAKHVTLAGDATVPYERLVIATGRRARAWPQPLEMSGCHVIRSIGDTLAFMREAIPGRRVVIAGAGFVGCEVAATLRGKGVEDITVIDPMPTPMPVVGPALGSFAMKYHEARGVRMLMGTSITEIGCVDGRVSSVSLDDGRTVGADVLLIAIGSVANTEFLDGSVIFTHRGSVACHDTLFVDGHPDTMAIGDVAAFPHPLDDGRVCVEHWSNAREGAEVAAHNLLAGPDEQLLAHVPVPTFWSDQYDLKIKSAGYLGVADTFDVLHCDPEKPAMLVEARRGDEMVGAVAVNRNRAIIDYTRQLARVAGVDARG